jgi:hypothetical protein
MIISNESAIVSISNNEPDYSNTYTDSIYVKILILYIITVVVSCIAYIISMSII